MPPKTKREPSASTSQSPKRQKTVNEVNEGRELARLWAIKQGLIASPDPVPPRKLSSSTPPLPEANKRRLRALSRRKSKIDTTSPSPPPPPPPPPRQSTPILSSSTSSSSSSSSSSERKKVKTTPKGVKAGTVIRNSQSPEESPPSTLFKTGDVCIYQDAQKVNHAVRIVSDKNRYIDDYTIEFILSPERQKQTVSKNLRLLTDVDMDMKRRDHGTPSLTTTSPFLRPSKQSLLPSPPAASPPPVVFKSPRQPQPQPPSQTPRKQLNKRKIFSNSFLLFQFLTVLVVAMAILTGLLYFEGGDLAHLTSSKDFMRRLSKFAKRVGFYRRLT